MERALDQFINATRTDIEMQRGTLFPISERPTGNLGHALVLRQISRECRR